MPSELQKTENLLKTKRYGLFWLSSLLSNIGTWMQQIAQPWVMLTISHSSFLVGLDSFAMNAPGWILSLWGGALADRLDRKKIVLLFQGIQFLAIVALVVLLAMGLLKPWSLIFISLLVGITDSLSMPSFQTIVPSLVKEEEIPKAVSLNSIQFNLSRTLGPALAGIVMTAFGAIACFGANAISFIPFFLSVFWIYPKKGFLSPQLEEGTPKTSILSTVKEAFKRDSVRSQLITTFVTTLFCSPLFIFSTVLIQDVFSGQVKDFGNTSTAFGLGGLVGAICTFFIATKFKQKSPGIFGLIHGLVIIAVAWNRSLSVLLCLMFSAGLLLTIANTSANSNMQLKAGNKARGQYTSLYQLSFRGGMALGALLTGLMTSHFGVVIAFYTNGALAVFIHLILLLKRSPHEKH